MRQRIKTFTCEFCGDKIYVDIDRFTRRAICEYIMEGKDTEAVLYCPMCGESFPVGIDVGLIEETINSLNMIHKNYIS